MVCQRCGAELRFERGRGWVHPGGGTYMWRCDHCQRTGDDYPTPTACPGCGGEVRDDHCVLPVKQTER